MKQFVIERNMPGIGNASADDLKGASNTSCDVLRAMGPEIQWVHSYVTDDKIYCVYRAENADMIRDHARRQVSLPTVCRRFARRSTPRPQADQKLLLSRGPGGGPPCHVPWRARALIAA